MRPISGKILLCYFLLLIASWRVMSWPSSPTPKGENWRSLLCHGEKGGLHYRVFSGTRTDLPPLILIHGSPMPSACFDQLLKSLPRDRSIFVPDLPGFGASSHGFSDFSFHAHRQALAQLLAHEKIQTAHWLAYSQGGGPVIELAAQQASAFSSLTLLSSIGVQEHELTGDYFLNHILHGAQWVALEALRWGTPHFGLLDQFLLNTHYAKNFYQSDLRPLRSHLSQFSPPTLIIHGQQDRLVTPASAREHQRIIPHSELTWLEGGHMILMSQPHLVATPLLEFLKKVDAGTAASRAQASTSRHQAAAKPADARAMRLQGTTLWLALLAIVLATLASEDLACIAAGLLVARGLISLPHGIAAAFFGIWIGDMALYAAGRLGGKHLITRRPLRWLISEKSISLARSFLIRKGGISILISRFTPGLRLPLYVVSGVVKMPLWRVATWFLLAGILWSIPAVSLTAKFGQSATRWLLEYGTAIFPLSILLLLTTYLLLKTSSRLITHHGRRIFLSSWQRTLRWEFWPPFVFYPPLACVVIWMALRRGRFLACTVTNPAIPHSGITGESKSMILNHLLSSDAVIPFLKLPDGLAAEKIAAAQAWHSGFPLVIKPDVGERGKGVVIVRNEEELMTEIASREAPTLIQHYADGEEFGVFYIRHPQQAQGQIFSLTIKKFTAVEGDGIRTLEDLILDDPRAFLSQKHFRNIYSEKLNWIPEHGEHVPLAKLGSHCRGALFLDGSHLITPNLTAEIHRIASTFTGFYFGRFDLRCQDEETLKRGEKIRIIELNGLTSEATHIYHPHTPLIRAYRTLCSQWRHAIEIGNANSMSGASVSKWSDIIHLLRAHFSPKEEMTSAPVASGYTIKTTRCPDNIRSAQQLRYAVFNVELGEGLDSSDHSGLDADSFDSQCDHLIIEDQESGNVIGTYRLQTGAMAASGIGYYSANEFDFSPYESIRHQVLELGRACIHADHRNRAVLDLLWSGIIRYAHQKGSRYLLGCSSLTSQNPAEGWALYEQLREKCLAPAHLQTQPIPPFTMPRPATLAEQVKCPKLFASYLAVGAWFAGPPALDKDFKTIDFLTILDIENISRAGRKHFFKNLD